MADALAGVYSGLVEDVRDPDKSGRLKVRVPTVFGSASDIGSNDLPWALPRGLPAGDGHNSGGLDFLPSVGDLVWVTFLDQQAEKPIWEWASQSRKQTRSKNVHSYGPDGKPNRAAMTRYSHTVELNSNSILLQTKKGNVVMVDDQADGLIVMANMGVQVVSDSLSFDGNRADVTIKDQLFVQAEEGSVVVKANDLATVVGEDAIHTAGMSMTFMVESSIGTSMVAIEGGRITVTDASGSVMALDGLGNIAFSTPDGTQVSLQANILELSNKDGSSLTLNGDTASITAPNIALNGSNVGLGTTPVSPVALANLLTIAFNAHIHSNGNNGSPTGPPIIPIVPEMIASKTTSA